jgi:hypothetical protein
MTGLKAGPDAYRFRLEFLQGRSSRVHEIELARADFDRAIEATFFDSLRRGLFTEYSPPLDQVRLEPRFVAGEGTPRTQGFTVVLPAPDGSDVRRAFDLLFFKNMGRRVGVELVAGRRVPEDAVLHYQLAAYLDAVEKPTVGELAIELEAAAPST